MTWELRIVLSGQHTLSKTLHSGCLHKGSYVVPCWVSTRNPNPGPQEKELHGRFWVFDGPQPPLASRAPASLPAPPASC